MIILEHMLSECGVLYYEIATPVMCLTLGMVRLDNTNAHFCTHMMDCKQQASSQVSRLILTA